MWTEDEMIQYLRENLKEKRFNHSINVRDTAVKLAKIYGEDVEKAKIAGLIHDCAKNMSDDEILDICRKDGYNIDEVSKNMPGILHGYVGGYIARNIMKIKDKEILNAIIYHTTGKKNMNLLEKIIYISDYIEPLRDFPQVDRLREVAYEEGIDEALILSFDNTIEHIVKKGRLLHKDTIDARNYILYTK